jgi:hypothetical protein
MTAFVLVELRFKRPRLRVWLPTRAALLLLLLPSLLLLGDAAVEEILPA